MSESSSLTIGRNVPLPTLHRLGPQLVRLSPLQRWFSIVLPVAYVLAFMVLATAGWWAGAVLAAAGYTFYSYGSTSHDLVHGNLGLPRWLNHLLLSFIELLGLRSGHAYRAAHLHHHARFPHSDDIEGAASHGSFAGAVLAGPLHQFRIWWWAIRFVRRDRAWIFFETVSCALMAAGAVAVLPITAVPLAYLTFVILGSWTIPLVTAYFPHNPNGEDALRQTRRFRGMIARVLFREHLYHLEHHLYPAVPHQNWPELAKRLDPYFDQAGIPTIRLERFFHIGA